MDYNISESRTNVKVNKNEVDSLEHFGGILRDEQERRKWQNPEEVLAEIGLQPGMTFIDIGCGQGFFTIPAAKIVGESGKVYASDINQINVNKLREKVNAAGLMNVIIQTGKAEDLKLCEACADIIFFGIVLHDFQDPLKVLANAHSMLKKPGKLVDLDWKKELMEFGPPLNIRFSEEKAIQLIELSGFKVQKLKASGLYHYLIVANL
jgi:ubiquinone/menaquinone biosynthesis C-methylase UbiE